MSEVQTLRVLDFTQVLSGPFCTMLLADAGADVVKVEPPGGDITRRWGPPFLEGESVYFAAFNRGKRSVALDLRDPEARRIALELARRADVVVENLRPGVLEGFGLGAGTLRAERPELIYASLRGYGRHSANAADPALEVILEAESGLMTITGSEGGEPTRLGVAAIDMMTGLSAVGRIFGALWRRDRSGVGDTIEVSLEETAALMMTHPWLMFLMGGQEYRASGSRHPNIAPYEVFRTRDRPILVGAVDDRQFRRLAEAIGRPQWPERPEWSTNARRVEDRDALHAAIETELIARDAAFWAKRFRQAHLPAGIVQDVPSAASNWRAGPAPSLRASHPLLGELRWPASPWAPQGGDVLAPPLLGSDMDGVLRDWSLA